MSEPRSFHVRGIRLDAAGETALVDRVAAWCRARTAGRARTVCFVNAFSIVTAAKDDEFREAINDSDLSVIDGVPVAWLSRRLVDGPCDRLSGPDMMHRLLSSPEFADIRHFVLGGEQQALDRLEFRYSRGGTLTPRRIVGTFSPPFRAMTAAEETALVERLNALKPDIVWVCLGTARQEKWMTLMRRRLDAGVLAGVGAAVDFLSGNKPRAPKWMQRAGLEWLFRLATEPRRLWRRYLIGNIVFMGMALSELRRGRSAGQEGA